MMNANAYSAAIILGILAGFLYFGGLRLTVSLGAKRQNYWLFPLSYFLRLALVAILFIFLLPKTFTASLLFLGGIIAARAALLKWTRKYADHA